MRCLHIVHVTWSQMLVLSVAYVRTYPLADPWGAPPAGAPQGSRFFCFDIQIFVFLPWSCFTVAASLHHAETVDCIELRGAYFFSIMACVLSSAFYQNYTRFTLHRTCCHLQVSVSKNRVIFQKGGSFKVWIFFFLSVIHVLTSKNKLCIYFIKFKCLKNLFIFN